MKSYKESKFAALLSGVNAKATVLYLLWGTDMLFARFMLGIASLFWAVLLLWHVPLFPTDEQIAAGTGRMTYALMAQMMPEKVWGALFLVHAVFTVVGVLLWRRYSTYFWAEGVLGCLLWTSSTAATFLAHSRLWGEFAPPAATASGIVLTMVAWWILVRYKVTS